MKAKYDTIGIGYNETRKADPYLTGRLLHHLNPQKGKQYLDIGCGTGNYTIALSHPDYRFYGVDPSETMLEKAKAKSRAIIWKKGTAENIPLRDAAMDGAIASLTLHHWNGLKLGFQELCRVLKPMRKIVIFTSTPGQMKGYWLNHYFPKMLQDSIIQMPDLEKVRNAMHATGFKIIHREKYFIKKDLRDMFLYVGKQQPELYLKANVRQGISSFSNLANIHEVEEGLQELGKDLVSGKIEEVIKHFENEEGDYLFIVAQKCE